MLATLSGAVPIQAQGVSFRVAAGAAVPAGGAAERRDAGPSAVVAVELRGSRRFGLRLDGEWSILRGPSAPAGQEEFSNFNDLRALGVSLNGVLRMSQRAAAPYLLAGAGAYRLQRAGARPSPYGTTAALQAGIGVDGDFCRRLAPFIEARAIAHFTDYGTREYATTAYFPILVGLRLR